MTLRKRDKMLIRQRFAQSKDYYLAHAHVQRQMAETLLSQLPSSLGKHFARILEVGCGCGLLTDMIASQLDYEKLFINDLVEEHHEIADNKPNCEFLPGDIEQIDDIPSELDLVISNATFQWLEDMELFLGRLGVCLKAGGCLAFSTFGVGNMREISQLTGVSLDYLSAEDLKQAVGKDFEISSFSDYQQKLEFKHPLEVLKHLKLTGVTGVSRKTWTRTSLRDFTEKYIDRFKSDNGVTLTYHPIVVVAMRK